MAKKFTHVESIDSLFLAIKAIVNGENEEVCKVLTVEALHTIQNSNSMVIAEARDKEIELDKILTAAGNQINGGIPAPELPKPKPELEETF